MADNEKILNTRIMLKVDTLERWKASTLPLKKGELAIATAAATLENGLTEPVCMIKIGEDGVKTFNDLDLNLYAKASDVLAACKTEAGLRAFVNNVIADAGIASDDAMQELAGRVTAVETKAGDNETAIGVLNGTGEGSVAKAISDAIAALDLANTYAAKSHDHVAADITDFNTAVTDVVGSDIQAAQKAGDDAQTHSERVAQDLADYETSNDARVKAVEDEIDGLGTMAKETATDYVKNTLIGYNPPSEVNVTLKEYIDLQDGSTLQEAKNYVDSKFTDADLAQYTTEQEVKDIIDGVIANAADDETYNSLTKLVDYIDAHGGEAADMAEAIDTLEGDVKSLKEAPPAGIKASDITNWNAEIGAKALAETKLDASTYNNYVSAHSGDFTNEQIGTAISNSVNPVAADLKAHTDISGDDTIHHTHENKEELNKISDGDVAKWNAATEKANTALQSAIQAIDTTGSNDYIRSTGSPIAMFSATDKLKDGIAAAETALQEIEPGTGLKVSAKANNKQTVEIDEAVTFVFDCGGAEA